MWAPMVGGVASGCTPECARLGETFSIFAIRTGHLSSSVVSSCSERRALVAGVVMPCQFFVMFILLSFVLMTKVCDNAGAPGSGIAERPPAAARGGSDFNERKDKEMCAPLRALCVR